MLGCAVVGVCRFEYVINVHCSSPDCGARAGVLVGAESTGKTTLAGALTETLRARGGAFAGATWVPEVGREVTEQRLRALGLEATPESLTWATSDFVDIARAQATREAAAARIGAPVLICDTDAFATGVWHERYLGTRAREVEAAGGPAPFHLYLLTHDADVPFMQDGLRDGEHLRAWMTNTFADRLTEARHRWTWLRGARQDRFESAMRAIDALLVDGWKFADPLG